MGKTRLMVLAAASLLGFFGYAYLFVAVLGVNSADAISVLTTGTVKGALPSGDAAVDSTAIEGTKEKEEAGISQADSLERQMTIINAAKTELETLRAEVNALINAKSKQDEAKLISLAKIYDGMEPAQLTTIMAGLSDSMVVSIIPRMKSQKVSKILEAMPPERAAKISALLIGRN